MLVIEFDRIDQFKGDILRELEELKRRGVIRVLDLLFVMKDEAGDIIAFEDSDLNDAEEMELGLLLGKMVGLEPRAQAAVEAGAVAMSEHDYGLTEEDIQAVANQIAPGTATGLLLVEHRWAIGFRDAVGTASGRMIAQGFLTPDALMMVGKELEAVIEAQTAIETAEVVKGAAMLDALTTVAAAEAVKEEALEEAAETVVAAEMIKTAAAIDAIEALIEASLIEEAAAQYAIEALAIAGLIEAETMQEAADVVAQAEAVAGRAFGEIDDKGQATVGETA
jgi:uncharacterized membrane protein